MANRRLYYAIKQVGIKPDGAPDGERDVVYGVQDLSISTNFNLQQVFEFGQLEIYENFEELPDVEVTVNKIFDGKPLLWHVSTKGRTSGTPGDDYPESPTLAGRSNEKCVLDLAVFPDTNDAAEGTPDAIVQCSGLFPRTLNYNITTDGAMTESLTFVGNDIIQSTDSKIINAAASGRANSLTFNGEFSSSSTDTPSGIERGEHIEFDVVNTGVGTDVNGTVADPDRTILPLEIQGISTSGTNDEVGGVRNAHPTSIAISTDLGREELNELGRRGPYHRYATFPTEVTCSIEAISTEGTNVSATEEGIYTTGTDCTSAAANLQDRTIRVATCGGVRLYLGAKNRLSSVDFGGGTTDGGNDTNTYNYTNFNILTVMAEYDPHISGSTWWTNRANYLVTS